uniref:Uncharacterized protein n=1 Tax=Anguilla anguilla TaxID=7936 RepID=A0A0E9TMW5_ANGAN
MASTGQASWQKPQ